MSKSRLLSGRVTRKSGSELDLTRYDFLDLASTEPNLGNPEYDGALLVSQADGTRLWSNNIRVDLTGNIAVGTISNSDGSSAISIVDDVIVEDNLTVQGLFSTTTATIQFISTADSSDLRIESGLIVEGNLTVQGTTTTINSTTLVIEDKNIELAKGAATAVEADGAGITVLGPTVPASLIYQSSTDSWVFNKDLQANVVGDVTGNIFTNLIDSADSSGILFVPQVTMSSDLTIENNVYADGDIVAQGNVTATNFFGTLEGNVKVGFGVSEFNDIRIRGVLVGDVLTAISAGNLRGDVLSENGVTVLESGVDGTDAVFTGAVIGAVFTNLIDSADSSEIVVTPKLVTSSDLEVQNRLIVSATAVVGESVTSPLFVGFLQGQVSDISNHYLGDLQDVDVTTSVPQDLDILAWNEGVQRWVPSGLSNQGLFTTSEVTFASLTANIITNYIFAPDSGDIVAGNRFVVTHDIVSENNIYSQNDIIATGNIEAQRFIGFLQGQISDISNHSIGSLYDVDISTLPLNNQTLVWNAAQDKFVPGDSFSQADFDTAFGEKSIGDLIDVDITTTAPTNGQSLVWNAALGIFLPGGQGVGVTDNVTFNSLTLESLDVATIGSPDSTAITIVNSAIFNSNITVENDLITEGNLTVDGDIFGNVVGQVSDISNHRLDDLSDVTIVNPQDKQALLYDAATNGFVLGSVVGQDVTSSADVVFNSITGDIFTNLVDSPDSSEITFVPAVRLNSDLTVENNGYFSNDLTVTRDVTAFRFVGFLDGLARDIDNTALTNKEFATELDIDLDQVFVYDTSAGELKKTKLSEIVSSGAAGFTGSQGFVGSQGDIGFTGSQGGTLFDFSVVGTAYRVTGLQGDFPVLNLLRGQLYYFDFSNVPSSDPLALRLETGNTAQVPGTEGNDTVSGTNGNLVIYRVPLDAPDFIVYQSTTNSTWIGLINIFDQVGYTGSAGYTGSLGFTGSQGDLGYTGSTGLDGFTGSAGDDGTSVKIVGVVATAGDLPDPYSGDIGDGYIVTDTGNLWSWSGTAWIEIGRILGYTGSQGQPDGYTGSKGDPGVAASFTTRAYTGDGSTRAFAVTEGNTIQTVLVFLNGVNQRPTDDYSVDNSTLTFATAPLTGELIIIREMPQAATGHTGSQGDVGFAGSQGTPGEAAAIGYTGSVGDVGFTGSEGDQGEPGTSVSIVGSVATVTDLPVVYNGDLGDGFITSDNGHLHVWNGTGWDDVGQVQGFTGSRGDVGFAGSQGDIGFTGSIGFSGSEGRGLDPWYRISANYTASSGNRLIADTTGGSFTVTLPPTPAVGDYIQITDAGDFFVIPLIIDPNGTDIEGEPDNISVDISGITVELIYDGVQWQITSTTGPAGPEGFTGSAGANGNRSVMLAQEGLLVVRIGTVRWYAPAALTILQTTFRLAVAADQIATIVINKSSTATRTINMPVGLVKAVDTNEFSMATDDYLTVDVTSTGSPGATTQGSDLNVVFLYEFAS